MIDARPARGFGLKRHVCVDVTPSDGNCLPFDEHDRRAQMVFDVKGIVVIA